MRGLSLTLAILLSTATLVAQRRHPTPPPAPPPTHGAAQPFVRPLSPPPVVPFPPPAPQPAGGLTPGVILTAPTHPAYNPPRFGHGRGDGNGGYGAYGGYGYAYAPDVQPTAAPPTSGSLEPAGFLRLSGTPGSAQVFVDGYYVASLADVETQRALTLPAGPHRIELKAPEYASTTFDVRIDPNDTVTYRASLDRARPAPPPAPATGPAKMYLIPNCYLGNVPPKPERLPSGCDAKRVQIIS